MNTPQRAAEGLISSLLRRQSRALHPRVRSRHGWEAMIAEPATALLVMDVEHGMADRYPDDVVERMAAAVCAARRAGMPVIFVRVALRGAGAPLEDDGGIHPDLTPIPGEPVVTRRRVNAFAGSPLDVVLRARGTRSLVLCGVATSGVVLSTLRAAADQDFELTVLRDACADADPDVHRMLLDKVFPRKADVVDVATWAAGLDDALAGESVGTRA
jgi:nicotinamidase-related amidase